jgi:hypothetical protein
MIKACEAVSDSFRKMWHKYFNPFGLEVIQIRQGGQILRLKETQCRINEYISGIVDSLPEPEEETTQSNNGNNYRAMATGSEQI